MWLCSVVTARIPTVTRKAKRSAAQVLPKIVKRQPPKKPARKPAPFTLVVPGGEKKPIGLPDPLEAAQEAQRLAQEGNVKLARSIDVLRMAVETIVSAERDNTTGLAVTAEDLRGIAIAGLNEYSRVSGQSWKRHKIVGNWAGGTGNKPIHEREMA